MNFEINLCKYLPFEEKENTLQKLFYRSFLMIETERAEVEWLFHEKRFPFGNLVLLFLVGGLCGVILVHRGCLISPM